MAKKMLKAGGFGSVRVVLDGVDNTRWFETGKRGEKAGRWIERCVTVQLIEQRQMKAVVQWREDWSCADRSTRVSAQLSVRVREKADQHWAVTEHNWL
eukprot:3181051-Rhodomonas_salina.1